MYELCAVIPPLSTSASLEKLFVDSLSTSLAIHQPSIPKMATLIQAQLSNGIGCKTALRIAERAVATAGPRQQFSDEKAWGEAQVIALDEILQDLEGDEFAASQMCEVIDI